MRKMEPQHRYGDPISNPNRIVEEFDKEIKGWSGGAKHVLSSPQCEVYYIDILWTLGKCFINRYLLCLLMSLS